MNRELVKYPYQYVLNPGKIQVLSLSQKSSLSDSIPTLYPVNFIKIPPKSRLVQRPQYDFTLSQSPYVLTPERGFTAGETTIKLSVYLEKYGNVRYEQQDMDRLWILLLGGCYTKHGRFTFNLIYERTVIGPHVFVRIY